MGQRTSLTVAEESDLLGRSIRGDREAFGALVRAFQDRIFATVYRILADREDARDLAQETFLRAWSRLATFREGARFSTWLYTIALNLTRSELRKRKARRGVKPVSLAGGSGDRDHEPAADGEEPVAELGRSELCRRALEEVGRLAEEAREVVVLRDLEDLSYEEIAGVLGVPVGTVRSRLHRARKELRERLAPLVADRRGGAA